jgi:phosphoenolpyruvate synthase/pyruvate phosphate dikinase
MTLVDKYKTMGVRTNADTPKDVEQATYFGAEGIGFSEQNTCSTVKVVINHYSY